MAETSSCPDLQQLVRLVLGNAPPEEVARLGRHLLACHSCVSTLHGLRAEDTLIQQLQAQATKEARPIQELLDSVIVRLQESAAGTASPAAPAKTAELAANQAPARTEAPGAFALGLGELNESGRIGNYQILKVLGSGGMGFVLLAQDVDLERSVALKVMRPEIAKDATARQRFLREARAAAALKHDYVVTIYHVGQDKDVPFLAMEFLEGESLESRLEREGKLPSADVLRIGREIAAGLAAAHARHLIHRDIKPANIWLEAGTGRVKILDFGLARPAADNAHLTGTGMVMGTPQYMAPEQARGDTLDPRCDLFSLGCVLYRACAGDVPFAGNTGMAVLMAVALDTPVPIRARNADAGPELAALVERLLAKDPANRPASAGEVVNALAAIEAGSPIPTVQEVRPPARDLPRQAPSLASRLAPARRPLVATAGLIGLALLALLVFRLIRPAATPEKLGPTDDGPRVIAVLPFVNAAADREIEHLRDGVPGAILQKLSEVEELTVRPYSAGPKNSTDEFDLREIGRKLEVQAVLTGRVRQSRDALSLHVELVDVRGNRAIWIEQYERPPADLQDIETDIALRVCARLGLSLKPGEERRLTRRDTPEADAHQLYLRGRHHALQYTLEGMNKSVAYFKQAIAKDPKYALAYSGLAEAYGAYAGDWMPYEEALPKQKAAAVKALELDDDLGEAHLALGNVYMRQDYDWPAAEKELKRAIKLKPKLDLAHDAYAQLLAFRGRFEESIAQQQEALELNPRSPYLIANLSYLYYLQRQYDQAIEQANKALEIDPDFVMAHDYRGAAYLRKSQFAAALEECRTCRRLDAVPWYLARLAAAQAVVGNKDEARTLLKELQELSKRRYVTPECFFLVYVALRENDQAFAWMQKMYDVRSQYPLRLNVQPDFDGLRADPRFADWLRRLKLAPS
jgi:serine/threonine-protein kinase